jgi:hypothetical protein
LNTDLSSYELSSANSKLNQIDESPETSKLNFDIRERRKSFKPIINLKKTGTLSNKIVMSILLLGYEEDESYKTEKHLQSEPKQRKANFRDYFKQSKRTSDS